MMAKSIPQRHSSDNAANRLRGPLGFVIAVAAVAAATLVEWLVDPLIGDALIFSSYFAAVVFTVAYGGFWPGVVATFLSVAAGDWFFIPPRYSFYIETTDLGTWLGIVTFIVVGITVSAINEALRRSRRSAHSAARQLAVAVDHAQFLSEASKSVAALVDVKSSMQTLAQLCVPRFADWCALYLVDEQGEIQPIAQAHADSQKAALLSEMIWQYHPSWRLSTISGRVLSSGNAEFVPEIPKSYLESVAHDAHHAELIQALAPHSAIVVPLDSRGRTIGMIHLVRSENRSQYSEAEYEVAQELARRAATAIDNSCLYDDLRAADRQKDDFLAMLAHELRNPLAAIDYATQLAGISPDQSANATEIIHRQVRHLARLIDDLLDVSRITRGKIELQREPIDAATIVNRAAGTARPTIDKHKHQFKIEIAPVEMPLFADPLRAEQIVVNLLTNAAKYTPEGGEISLKAYPDNDDVVINVRDSGIGIPKEMLPRVFELFTQVNPEIDRTKGGLGIGLTVVRRLTEKHGGTVSATSDGLGKGTEFTVRLPRSTDGADRDVSRAQPARPPRGLRVLVVEDNVDAAAAVSQLLTQAGCDTKVAHDGPTALESADAFRPQVVLLDIGLPGLDGYEVACRLRADLLHEDLRLIALTGYGQAHDQKRSKEAGFDHHLVKPVDFQSLLAVLAESPVGQATA
jgi:K+-sensing histidine kinase KdpD/ActR/RegA family two-component response regulator